MEQSALENPYSHNTSRQGQGRGRPFRISLTRADQGLVRMPNMRFSLHLVLFIILASRLVQLYL